MLRLKYVLQSLLLASVLSLVPFGGIPAFADDAADALKKCDALASHPHDPGRYAAPVPDDQFAPGAAIEACEPAVKLNPDLARAWFELGRSYWIGQRDADAFRAFVEAAKRNYAPAMKFIGDAYLEGRGLPSGQQRDTQTALQWYKKSSAGGFSDGTKAAEETEAAIQKKIADARKEEFDPSSFQNKQYMNVIYYNNIRNIDSNEFYWYIFSFAKEMQDKIFFLQNGQNCSPLLSGNVYPNAINSIHVHRSSVQDLFNNKIGDDTNTDWRGMQQGANDAITLFNRYGCDSDVAKAIFTHINARFDPAFGETQPNVSTPRSTASLRQPTWYDCAKASKGADYVICASPVLLDAVARLEDAFKAAHAARGVQMEAAHKAWLHTYSQNCGLPANGRPDDSQITSARECVLTSINNRIAELESGQ